eukprot:gene47813-67047_t
MITITTEEDVAGLLGRVPPEPIPEVEVRVRQASHSERTKARVASKVSLAREWIGRAKRMIVGRGAVPTDKQVEEAE